MNPISIEESSETAPLKPTAAPPSYLSVAEAGRTFGTTFFLV
jgi:hypothetical protein